MVIMDMENGNQVSKWDIIVPKVLGGRGGGNYPQDSRGDLITPPIYAPGCGKWLSRYGGSVKSG